MKIPFRSFKTSPEIIRLAVMMYVRIPLARQNAKDLLHERGIDIGHETVRSWWIRFGPVFATEVRKRRARNLRKNLQWQRHLDKVFVRFHGEIRYLWPAVDHEGEVLEAFVSKRRSHKVALTFLRKTLKRYGRWEVLVMDCLRSYRAAMRTIGNKARQPPGRRLNNRALNSHQQVRRRECAMAKLGSTKSRRRITAVRSQVHNHFNCERRLYSRDYFKFNRPSALAEWTQLAA